MSETLIFIPTFNESGNPSKLVEVIKKLDVKADILFLDDNSLDGTGKEIDELARTNTNVFVIHRPSRLGIGTAHLDGIGFAYKKAYKFLITMDADFTHPPEYIPELFKALGAYDLVVGSRHIKKDSMKGWNPLRKIMTKSAYLMTTYFLGMSWDATGSFRLYKLGNIDISIWQKIESKNYSFFYESLYVLFVNSIKITQIPIHLPPREAGSSKMKVAHAIESMLFLFKLKTKAMLGKI